MAAIKLLTDEYDRNIVYRQQLKSSLFGLDHEELNYYLTIAFPCAGGNVDQALSGEFQVGPKTVASQTLAVQLCFATIALILNALYIV